MSAENIATFLAKAQNDPALAEKISLGTAQLFATLSEQEGTPFTTEEFLAAQKNALADEELTAISGGFVGHIFEFLTGHTPKSVSEARGVSGLPNVQPQHK